ncbi:MAG: tetratricopeptide repeat protein [Saprospiraceae bacterium]|nr:tetratricopeptide repeat protein [Saprospiraceae bacterium]
MKRILYLVSILFSLQNYSFSQDQVAIDSLEALLKVHYAKKIELQIKFPSLYDTTAAIILNQIAKVYNGNNPDKAIDYANQSLSLSEQLAYKKGIGNAYNNMGTIFQSKPDYLTSLEFYKKALKIREEAGDKKSIAYSYHNIGNIYRHLDNYPEALKNYFATLKIFEELGDKKGIANTYNNIGVVYHDQDNYPEALKNYFASLKIREEIGDKNGIAYCYNNLAIIYRNQRKYPEALKNSFASLKIKEEIGDKKGIANTYSNIGSIHCDQGNYQEALKNHFASLKINEEIGNKDDIGAICLDIGLTKLKMKAAREAKDWQSKALRLGKAIESLSLMQRSYEGLAAADSALGNFKAAYENHKLFILYRDSIENTENAKKIITLQMNYDFGKKQDSLNVVQTKKDLIALKELNKQKLVRNGFIWGTIILLFLTGTAILFFIDRTKRNRMKQLEAVRGSISRDLHDDIGSTLQSISVMSEIARMKSTSGGSQESIPFLEKIGRASRDMMEKMNDLVWAVSPQNDNFENIIYHMRAFGGELLAGKDIALHFKSDSDLNSIILSMEKRKSFFLVYKEALNNIYKYSGAKNVTVEISKTNHKLNLVVLDDGVGFNMNENHLKIGGNGLKNMNARAAELNGTISITSAPGKGTTVSLMVNLK